MDNIIIARHGEYDREKGLLTEFGKNQIAILSKKISEYADCNSLILTSPSDRTKHSSGIIKGLLGIPSGIIALDSLSSKNGIDCGCYAKTLAVIRKYESKFKTLIIVTHFDNARSLLSYYTEEEFGRKIPQQVIERGHAIAISCGDLSYKILTPYESAA